MIEEFSYFGKQLFERGLVDSHAGSISIRRDDKILITKKDVMLGAMVESDHLVEAALEGGSEKEADVPREIVVHRAIYKNTKALAVIHAYSPFAAVVSISDNKVVPQDIRGISMIKSAPIIRAGDIGAPDDVARIITQFLAGSSGVAVVKGGGSFTFGLTLAEAFKLTTVLENSCKIIVSLRSAQPQKKEQPAPLHHRKAIPPGIGVMDRTRYRRDKFDNR